MLPTGAPGSTRGRVTARRSVPLLALALAALGSMLGVAGCGSDADDRPAKWSFISATIIEPACATVGCHSALAQQASVNLSARDVGYDALYNRHFVTPGFPDQSAVIGLMKGQGSVRMPPDLPLPGPDIALIGQWIVNGANND